MSKTTVGVLMGGTSAEREVSLNSGAAVLGALLRRGYDAIKVDAGADVCEALRRENIDLAFLVLHGGTGEDGSIQGMLEVMGIPYTGSGVLASALAMDKLASKKAFVFEGLRVPPFELVSSGQSPSFEPPYVVKPVSEGSSIGISIVRDATGAQAALKAAQGFGGPALIEKFIQGKEINIGVLGNTVLGGVEVRPSLEFYSYEAKYTAGMTQYILPPELDDKAYEAAKDVGQRAHKALGCTGASRVDLLIDALGDCYVLEVNTIPGMTETSLLPKIAGLAGYGFDDLVEEILKDAMQREAG